MTTLHASPIFGPVHSRRLGVSLGINLLPGDRKICSFDCIYCECGYNSDHHSHSTFSDREEVVSALKEKLEDMKKNGPKPDVLTFAGNGEPTLHPQFPEILDDVIALRDIYFPDCKISVLSNATQILKPRIFEALKKVDNNILKLDTVSMAYIHAVDRPADRNYDVERIVSKMADYGKACIIQTMFMKGTHEGKDMSNTADKYVAPWLEAVKRINPACVMIYTIDRDTPSPRLEKATKAELDAIAEKVREAGMECQVSY